MDTFLPGSTPDQDMQVEYEPKFVRTGFLDGYDQETGKGLNNDPITLSPKWTNLKYTLANPILAFLEAKAKSREPFYWTPPEDVQRVFKCTRVRKAWKSGRFATIEANLEETYPAVV